MKLRWLLPLLLLAGCAYQKVHPEMVTITAHAVPGEANAYPGEMRIIMDVHNMGRAPLRLAIDGQNGPPYELDWTLYTILSTDAHGVVSDTAHSVFSDGVVPSARIKIGAGDRVQLKGFIENVVPNDCTTTYRVQIRDYQDVVFLSPPFTTCVGSDRETRSGPP